MHRFCKYAKFDYTLTAKACCAVDPIENEDDRKKVRPQDGESMNKKKQEKKAEEKEQMLAGYLRCRTLGTD